MSSKTPYLGAVFPALPADIAISLRNLCGSPAAEDILDGLIRFISGAEYSPSSSPDTRKQWAEQQLKVKKIFDDLKRPPSEAKRQREDDLESDSESQKAKRRRLPTPSGSGTPAEEEKPSAEDDMRVYTLSSVSTTSPVRKKVDITVYKSSIKFTNLSTHTLEATIPLSSIRRAFILPTRGKQKPHWTIVLLSSDIPDRKTTGTSNPQVIFGLDAATTTPWTTTVYESGSPAPSTTPKGGVTLPSIRAFLSHLPGVEVLEPTTAVFKSAVGGTGSGSTGVPGIEAYRGAKAGTLWFMKEGILWGEGKPCEFWSVEDLISKTDGLRVVNAGGRTCTVILTRKSGADEEVGEDEEDVGIESEFSMVNSREQDGISRWERQYRHLFGKKKLVEGQNGTATANGHMDDESDESDEDFEIDSDEDDNGSPSSDSEDDEEGGGGQNEDKDAEESDAEGSDVGSEEDAEGELQAENHPLMRPGAMPRMSRAAIDMVVGMVEEDMMGPAQGDESEEEKDELED